jgi:hypothetical protein
MVRHQNGRRQVTQSVVDANSGADHQKGSEKVHDDTESGADYQKAFNFQRSDVAVIE